MTARQVVLVNPGGSVHPSQLPFYKHSHRITHLESTLARFPISVDSKPLTGMLTLLESTLTKRRGRGGVPIELRDPRSPIYLSSFQSFAHSFAITKVLTPVLSINCALFSKNTRGGGTRPTVSIYPTQDSHSPSLRVAAPLSGCYDLVLHVPC